MGRTPPRRTWNLRHPGVSGGGGASTHTCLASRRGPHSARPRGKRRCPEPTRSGHSSQPSIVNEQEGSARTQATRLTPEPGEEGAKRGQAVDRGPITPEWAAVQRERARTSRGEPGTHSTGSPAEKLCKPAREPRPSSAQGKRAAATGQRAWTRTHARTHTRGARPHALPAPPPRRRGTHLGAAGAKSVLLTPSCSYSPSNR